MVRFAKLENLMKRQTLRSFLLLAASLVGLAAAPTAQAATWSGSWDYASCGNPAQAAANTLSWGNSYTCSDSSLPANANMNISGWSSDLTPSTAFVAAGIYPWGSSAGFGVVNKEECTDGSGNVSTKVCDPGAGPHAADGVSNLDGFLMKFSNNPTDIVKVALESVQIGWNGSDDKGITGATKGSACTGYCDSDMSVYYYTGSSDPNMGLISAASLKGATTTVAVNGWLLLGTYADVGLMTNNTLSLGNTGAGAKSSSWWLVTAANSTTMDGNADAFKLLSVAGTGDTTKRTPEPGSLALAGLALFGMVGLRRKAKQD
jgi:hypothetical protein